MLYVVLSSWRNISGWRTVFRRVTMMDVTFFRLFVSFYVECLLWLTILLCSPFRRSFNLAVYVLSLIRPRMCILS